MNLVSDSQLPPTVVSQKAVSLHCLDVARAHNHSFDFTRNDEWTFGIEGYMQPGSPGWKLVSIYTPAHQCQTCNCGYDCHAVPSAVTVVMSPLLCDLAVRSKSK